MQITYWLGVNYIRIGPLYIIQENSSDWERKTSKMGEVYTNSCLTITASSSTKVNGELFHGLEFRINNVSHESPDTKSMGLPTSRNIPPNIVKCGYSLSHVN